MEPEKQMHPHSKGNYTSISPAELLQQLQVAGKKGRQVIEGKAMEVTVHDQHEYITLFGGGNVIKVRAKRQGIKLTSTLRCEGMVYVNIPKNTFTAGFEVLMDADTVKILEFPRVVQASEIRVQQRTSLEQFVQAHNTYPLHWLCTEVGYQDAFREFSKRYTGAKPFKHTLVNMLDEGKILEAARAAVQGGARGLVLARGGGDTAGLILWDDVGLVQGLLSLNVPIYAALGHEKDRFLMDRVADESFATPTAVGSALARALDRKLAAERSQRKTGRRQPQSTSTAGFPEWAKWVVGSIGFLYLLKACGFLH